MSDDITGDLDLLGDWLDAKGYTEEAGLCTRAMDEINKFRAENEKLRAELHDANEALTVAYLHGYSKASEQARAAAAALKDTGD